jgi:hypothetical protein
VLDFLELPVDGNKFELLIRELTLTQKLRPYWTGKGPDGGRDLIIEESLKGTLRDGSRRWLVDCKHYAHSGRAVGVGDVYDIRDRCEQVNASGILLACTTHVSSGLIQKLQELTNNNGFLFEIWDSVTLERMLTTPNTYFLAQQFFPTSLSDPAWRVFYTDSEDRWIANYKGQFLYLESRAGIYHLPLRDAETIIEGIGNVGVGEGEQLRIRRIWHDTPNGPFYTVEFDYLVPSTSPPSRSVSDLHAELSQCCILGGHVSWYVRVQVVLLMSDYYFPDDPMYYYFNGVYKENSQVFHYVDDLLADDRWNYIHPPLVRTINDKMMWNRDRCNFETRIDRLLRERTSN